VGLAPGGCRLAGANLLSNGPSNLQGGSDGKPAFQSQKTGDRLPRIAAPPERLPISQRTWFRRARYAVMAVSLSVGLVTAPGVLLEDVPKGLDLWRCALSTIGARPVELLVLILSACLFLIGGFAPLLLRRREAAQAAGGDPAPEATDDPDDELVRALRGEQRAGDSLAGEAQTLEPIGNMERVEDLVRRYDAFEGRVADILARTTRLDPQWRDAWLRDPEWHSRDVYPISRELLDAMARMIGHRVRLIEGMIRTLEGAPALRRALTRLIGRGTDLQREAELAGYAAESTLDRRSPAEIAIEKEALLRRESEWMGEVEEVLADQEGYLRRFAEASDIPSIGIFAVSQRMKARVAVLREIRDAL
jgi:hypothetical protein